MSERVEWVLRTVLIGVGATLVMDARAFLINQLGVPSLSFALLGRWIGHLSEGNGCTRARSVRRTIDPVSSASQLR